MTEAIIFDCFGVLVTEALESFHYKYFRNDPKKQAAVHELSDQLNMGEITYNQCLRETAKLAGITAEEAHAFINDNRPNLQLFSYIRSNLKSKYKIGMLSNAGEDWLGKLFVPDQLELFDDTVLSFNFGLVKPQPEIYQLAAQRLQVEPEQCVFIDDLQKHTDGGKGAGMQVILYQNFRQMKQELEVILAKT